MTVLYLTAINMSRVREARWVYGAFHLDPQCSEVRRHCSCPRDLAKVTVPNLPLASAAWKTRITLGTLTVGHLCSLCWSAATRAVRAQEIAQALAGAP